MFSGGMKKGITGSNGLICLIYDKYGCWFWPANSTHGGFTFYIRVFPKKYLQKINQKIFPNT